VAHRRWRRHGKRRRRSPLAASQTPRRPGRRELPSHGASHWTAILVAWRARARKRRGDRGPARLSGGGGQRDCSAVFWCAHYSWILLDGALRMIFANKSHVV
jgi:hypothetical protein